MTRKESFTQRRNREERRKMMIKSVHDFFAAKRPGYTPVSKATKGRCGRCNDASVICYFTPDKTEVIRVCFHRYSPITELKCNWTDKVAAAEIQPSWKKAAAKTAESNKASAAV